MTAGPPACDRGSLAIEYVIVAPLFLMVFALIFAFARVSELDGLLDSGARDAARAVSVSPDLSASKVHQVALDSLQQELGGGSGGCNRGTVSVTVVGLNPTTNAEDTDPLEPGDIATVTASCHYSLSGLGLPVPGLSNLKKTAVFSAIIEPNRSTT
jgi:Flp pilus assembly protein TadG